MGCGAVKRQMTSTEQTIIEAGRRLLATKKPSEVSIQDIIDAAGCSITGFYRSFASKSDLLEALRRKETTRLIKLRDDLALLQNVEWPIERRQERFRELFDDLRAELPDPSSLVETTSLFHTLLISTPETTAILSPDKAHAVAWIVIMMRHLDLDEATTRISLLSSDRHHQISDLLAPGVVRLVVEPPTITRLPHLDLEEFAAYGPPPTEGPAPGSPYVHPPAQARSKDTVRRIVNAFIDISRNRPDVRPTVLDICCTANVSHSSFYARFQSVDDLVRHIAHTWGTQSTRKASALMEEMATLDLGEATALATAASYHFLRRWSGILDRVLLDEAAAEQRSHARAEMQAKLLTILQERNDLWGAIEIQSAGAAIAVANALLKIVAGLSLANQAEAQRALLVITNLVYEIIVNDPAGNCC